MILHRQLLGFFSADLYMLFFACIIWNITEMLLSRSKLHYAFRKGSYLSFFCNPEMDPNAAGLILGEVNDHFIQIEPISVREETGKALENIVKGQSKHEIQDEYTSSGKSMVQRVGKWESKESDFHSLVQRLNGEVKVGKKKFENLEMTRTRNEDVERPVEGFKVEERLDKVVTRFLNRLPVFDGFLVMLYNKDFPCEMLKFFAFLITLSCMGLILVGGLATFHFWAIKVDLYENLNTKKKGGSRSQANTGLPLSGESRAGESTHDNIVGLVSSDIENGDNCHRFCTFWWYAWPHVIDITVMLIIALVFVLAIGKSQKMRCLSFTYTNTS